MTRGRNGQNLTVLTVEEQLAIALAQNAELQSENAALKEQLRKNPLTGLVSRYGFDEIKARLQAFISDKNLTGNGCYVGIDLDGFKGVNDTHGHDVGDEVLKHFANRLAEKLRAHELHADRVPVFTEGIHPSGDEYGILVVEAVALDIRTHEERRADSREQKSDRRGNPNRLRDEIDDLMQEIIQEISQNPLVIEGKDGPIFVTHGVSYGIGKFASPEPESIKIAEKDADLSMFQMKSGQSAFIKSFEKMDAELQEFAREIMGDRASLDAEIAKSGPSRNSIGITAYYSDSRLPALIEALDDEAMKWVFPELAPSRNKELQDLSL